MYASIDGTDISKHIQRDTYNVNSEEISLYNWQDANGGYHRDIARTRITGSFSLAFYGNGSTYKSFIDLFQSKASNGKITISLYVSNLNVTKSITAFYKLSSDKHYELKNGMKVDTIMLQLEEV